MHSAPLTTVLGVVLSILGSRGVLALPADTPVFVNRTVGATAKVYPDSPLWPTKQDWQLFNKTLDGRLIKFIPPGAACGQADQSLADLCTRYEAHTRNATWIAQSPGLTNWPQWAQGEDYYPSYVVAAESAQDVSTAFKFAAQRNLRVIVKNTGHDFLGRNVGYGALSIWTHRLQGVEWIPKWNGNTSSVDVSGQWKGAAVRYAGGSTWADVQKVTDRFKHIVVTGAESTVGAAGGWLQGGGHGPYSNRYGLGVEQVLELEAVTPTGDIVVANEQSHADLFWALRGGGGGTFAVVTKVTYKAYPTPDVGALMLTIMPAKKNDSVAQESYYRAVAHFLTLHPDLCDTGISGYPLVTRTSYIGLYMAPNLTYANLRDFVSPIAQRLRNDGVSFRYVPVGPSVINALYALGSNYNGLFSSSSSSSPSINRLAEPAGFAYAMASRLLSRAALSPANTQNITAMVRTVLSQDNAFLLPYPNMPGRQHQERPWNIGLHPAWRTASLHLIAVWNEGVNGRGIGNVGIGPWKRAEHITDSAGSPASASQAQTRERQRTHAANIKEQLAKVRAMEATVRSSWIPALDALAPPADTPAAYLNEGSPYEPDWRTVYFGGGQRYEKLLAVKKRYDPESLLWCFPCVGSEGMKEVAGRLVWAAEG